MPLRPLRGGAALELVRISPGIEGSVIFAAPMVDVADREPGDCPVLVLDRRIRRDGLEKRQLFV
jgi:hypothetical protein